MIYVAQSNGYRPRCLVYKLHPQSFTIRGCILGMIFLHRLFTIFFLYDDDVDQRCQQFINFRKMHGKENIERLGSYRTIQGSSRMVQGRYRTIG